MTSTRSSQPAVSSTSGLPYGYVPAYLPGSASLVEQLDQELLIVLRDGRHLVSENCNDPSPTLITIIVLIIICFLFPDRP